MLKKFSKKTIIILIVVVLLSVIVLVCRNDWVTIISMYLISCFLLCMYKFNILHPLVMFPLVYTLYSTAYPILVLNGIDVYTALPIHENLLLYEWIGLITFVVMSKKEYVVIDSNQRNEYNSIFLEVIFWVFSAISFINSAILLIEGRTTRGDVLDNRSSFEFFAAMIQFAYILIVMLIQTNKNFTKVKSGVYVFIGLAAMIVAYGATGERSLALNYILCAFLVLIIKYKIKARTIITFGIVFTVIFFYSSDYRMFLMKGAHDYRKTTEILEKFFMADFAAASFNFNNLLTYDGMWDFKWGITLLRDIWGSIPLLGDIGDAKLWSASLIYYEIFYSGSGKYAFTMVGEGYMNFGIFGIVLWYIIIARMLTFLYNRTTKSSEDFIRYIFVLASSLLSNTRTLETIFSPMIKYSVVFLYAVILASRLIDYWIYNKEARILSD